MPDISFYHHARDPRSQERIPFDIFLDNIKNGEWQDLVLPYRLLKDKVERENYKLSVPGVTVSGLFSQRAAANLLQHSGYLLLDIDKLPDPEKAKATLIEDRHTYACFRSISGFGLCLIIKINPKSHTDAYNGACEYFFKNYGIPIDPSCKDVSRLRFISFDPDLYLNEAADKFTFTVKPKTPKVDKVLFEQTDFDNIIQQIQQGRVNICNDYFEWRNVGFALSDQFRESGRVYFKIVSEASATYRPDSRAASDQLTDRQYDMCLKARGQEKVTIATFYYYCKEHGITIYSERTKKIAHSATYGKKGGLSEAQVCDNLEKFEQITDAAQLVAQVYQSSVTLSAEDSLLDQLELYLRQNYKLKRNSVTRYIESDTRNMEDTDFNSVFIRAKKVLDKINFELLNRLIHSDFVQTYNPFLDFFEQNKERSTTGHIDKLFSSLGDNNTKYAQFFGRKWLVSLIASIHGKHSPLVLILTGKQKTGKTEFFRRLLPDQLKRYYAESKLDAGTDDEILMTQKLIVMDDEMGGKSKRESKRLNELTSKQTFSLREPYGRANVDLIRLASLCGTSNDNELLNDPFGNRRLICVNIVQKIDFELYNAVDKTDLLMEAHGLYVDGFNYELSDDDVTLLNQDSQIFEAISVEADLITQHFVPGDSQMTPTEIKVILENISRQKLFGERIGKELKRLGFEQKIIKRNGATCRVYGVKQLGLLDTNKDEEVLPTEELPF